MLDIVLTREDANTEYALLAEWLVEDRVEVEAGQNCRAGVGNQG